AYGTVDVEYLEHQLQPAPAQLGPGLQRGRRQWTAGLLQRADNAAHLELRRERERREVPPDRRVLRTRQQQHVGLRHSAAGPADLLVVGDRRVRRTEVHDEP